MCRMGAGDWPPSPHFSPNQVHWGGDSERIVLQPRFFLNPQDAPMLTECSPALFDWSWTAVLLSMTSTPVIPSTYPQGAEYIFYSAVPRHGL